MASYATIPAEAEAEKPLLNRDLRVNLKTVIGGAAVASFVLGALAAAVVSGAPARTNSAALYAHSGYQPSAYAPMAFHAGKKNGESCKKDAECRSGDCQDTTGTDELGRMHCMSVRVGAQVLVPPRRASSVNRRGLGRVEARSG